ncbi:uncharacterized protein LOC144564653 [Carex rostrata]
MSNDPSNNKDGPDFIGYYRDLFSMEISKIEEQPISKSVRYFSNCLGGGFFDYNAKLGYVLHEAATVLNRETNELLEKIIAKLEAESDLGQLPFFSGNSNKESTPEASINRKRKMPSGPDFSQRANGFHSSELVEKVYRDIQSLQGNGEVHQEAVDQYSADILQKLCMMEQGVEEFLNVVVVNCREMTSAEKQQLGQRIQKLPEKAYGRLIEIYQSRKPFSRQNSDSVFINLEKQDNATLWRLYYYVETVLRASKT